jgi:hypothetical protein
LIPVAAPELAPNASTDNADAHNGVERIATEPMTGASTDNAADENGDTTSEPSLRGLILHKPAPIALSADLLPACVNRSFGSAAASPAFLLPALCACSAAAGNVRLLNESGTLGSISLRAVFVTEDRRLPRQALPVIEAAYEVEKQDVTAWARVRQAREYEQHVFDYRHRLITTTWNGVDLLGLHGVQRPDESLRPELPLRPRFVVDDVRPTTLTKAMQAAKHGLLVISNGKMPTFSAIGTNYDAESANVLNADGTKIAIEDTAGCVQMRLLTISTVGAMTAVDALGLWKATPEALAATIVVPPGTGDAVAGGTAFEGLSTVLARLRTTCRGAGTLRLTLSPEARNCLDNARREFEGSNQILVPPMSYFCAGLADLAERLAAQLHLIKQVVEAPSKSPELIIQVDEMDCAVRFVRHYVTPAADSVLSQASVEPVIRNGRRILSYSQQHASRLNPEVRRRDLLRSSRRVANAAENDDALVMLAEDGLITYRPGAATFKVHEVVFAPANRLPDLVGDPRRT